ncbi:GTP-binding protein YPT7, putative [Perkinsus marinus ATCC 50983]|uniref:GTP-binding protein YPT7, putative n=1 Tax=Perkinsus marinus (strain ATCC 50983 / TXsc) TaxID=423536 RepID=C5L6J6_PERM5|nr:GTP-binding protein YPT7, putative [Perkinsus marinus ATCC 50983]EER07657.1 GTP-binding protein YPT7, putative [Perkinsus marinus ATCC 50983]|eukprot:XP_002775841.1 GTP-binding protein YPT7, putative [Perkinsus marinus ATCC 50983]
MHGSFSHHSYKPTVGADFYSKKLDIIPDLERFRSLGASFYRGADACILVCDVSRQYGLKNVLDWRRDFLKHADPDEPEKFPFVFVANKTDLPEHAFTESDVVELITEIRKEYPCCADYPVVMASAENGSGVRQVFELAGTAAVQRANENDRRFSPQGLPGGYNKQCRELRTQLATRIEGYLGEDVVRDVPVSMT